MKFVNKKDVIIIIVLLIVSASLIKVYGYINGDKASKVEIYYESQLVETIDIEEAENSTFSIPQEEHVIFRIENGSIRFEESDCPDKVCIRAGELSVVGESATCLPNKITIKIVPKGNHSDDDIDIIVGK